MQTILHVNNPHVEAFRTAGASLTQLLKDHYVSSYTLADVQARTDLDPTLISVNIDPVIPEGENPAVPAIEFSADESVIQEMTTATYHQLRQEQPELFPVPEAEPEPEPRYKTHMTQAEFVRDVLTDVEWLAIGEQVKTNPQAFAWSMITTAGEVWVEHPDFTAGLKLGIDLKIWNEDRATEIGKGLLIT